MKSKKFAIEIWNHFKALLYIAVKEPEMFGLILAATPLIMIHIVSNSILNWLEGGSE